MLHLLEIIGITSTHTTDSIYKSNQYMLHLLEMIGITSTHTTYSVVFEFLECEKEDNITCVLEMCCNIL